MYESNINNETTITAKPIFLGENQEYSTPITTTENTFNYNDGNVQDITNQYSIPQNDQNIDITHNYQSTDNYQVFQSTPMTTTENYNQFQYETQPQTIYQSTPVTTTTTTTKTNYNTLQGFTPVQESTYTQNYSTNLNNIVQQSNVIPTTTSTTPSVPPTPSPCTPSSRSRSPRTPHSNSSRRADPSLAATACAPSGHRASSCS